MSRRWQRASSAGDTGPAPQSRRRQRTRGRSSTAITAATVSAAGGDIVLGLHEVAAQREADRILRVAVGAAKRPDTLTGRIDAETVREALTTMDSRETPVETLADAEEDQIRKVLQATGGNKSKAAQVLGIDAKNQDFIRYDQVNKRQEYRLAEADDRESFDEAYRIKSVDVGS